MLSRGKIPGKVKELQLHPYFKKKYFFFRTLPDYRDFDEHILLAPIKLTFWIYIANAGHGMAFINSTF